tara:strand:+ start:7316 stop:7561 length:246 start_codon:yes stop_codon:yes gene_type:complete
MLFFFNIFGIGITNIIRYNNYKLKYKVTVNKIKNIKQKKSELVTILNQKNNNAFWELCAKTKLGYKNQEERVYLFKHDRRK